MEQKLVELFLGFRILGNIILLKFHLAVAGSHGGKHILHIVLLFNSLLLALFLHFFGLWLLLLTLFLLALFGFLVELLDLLGEHVDDLSLLIVFHILDDGGRFGLRNAVKDCFDAALGGLEGLLEFFDDWGTDELVEVGLDFRVDGVAVRIFALLDPVESEDEVSQHLLRENNS